MKVVLTTPILEIFMFIFYSIFFKNDANYHSLAMAQADGSSHD